MKLARRRVPTNKLLRSICPATSATANVVNLTSAAAGPLRAKNRPDVTICGIWFARRSIQDSAGCLKQEIRMSLRIGCDEKEIVCSGVPLVVIE
jgi:hypothetical protein